MENMEFEYCYTENIVKNQNGTYAITVYGDALYDSFADILYDIKENDLNSYDCIINYYGSFGEEYDEEWCTTILEVANAVKKINIMNYSDLTGNEKKVINKAINSIEIDVQKINFVD